MCLNVVQSLQPGIHSSVTCKDYMKISSYQSPYYDLLKMLFETHNQYEPPISLDLPKIGYICMEGAIPVAIGFLRIYGSYAIFEFCITNGDLDDEMQQDGKDLIVQQLLQTAKSLNVQVNMYIY